MRTKHTMYLAVAVILTAGFSVNATLSIELDTIFDGPGTPVNPGPWVTAVFTDIEPGTVDLTISTPNLDGDNEKVAGVYFNFDPDLDVTQLLFSKQSKTGKLKDPVISLGQDGYKADGDGWYDIRINFNNSNAALAFNGQEEIQYTITLPGLEAKSFDFLSTPQGECGPHLAAAHLLSLGVENDSAWIAAPEPATLTLLAMGGLLLRSRKSSHLIVQNP